MRTFLKHAGLWLGIYVVYTYMMSYYDDLRPRAMANILNVGLFIFAYYVLKYVQIPHLYDKGKMLGFGLSLMATSLVLAATCRINGILWMDAMFGVTQDIPFLTPGSYLLKTVRFYTPAMAILAWESHQERRKELDRMRLLEQEKIANEMKFLKAQLNPHFLFNTLNNIYSFVQQQSPKAPKMIMYLSGILDYVLYKSQLDKVLLKEEVETIQQFIQLESIRYGDRLTVELTESLTGQAYISPLLLLSMVENAFKHGASGDIDCPQILIEIANDEDSLHCRVWNTKSQYQGELNDAYKKGIGLSNLKRQLDLIYPHQYTLQVDDLPDSFCLNLHITAIHA